MMLFLSKITQLRWQLPIALFPVIGAGLCLLFPSVSGTELTSLDRATFITMLSAVATILTLFCSLSIAWILFVSQQIRTERLAAFDTLKARILEVQRWLLAEIASEDRTVCITLANELDKLALSDLPSTDRGDAYDAYCAALKAGLHSEDQFRREFFRQSAMHFGYIEHLLNRLGEAAIWHMIAKLFFDALAKGVVLVALSVGALFVSTLWFNESIKPWLVLVIGFCGIASSLLLLEFWVYLRRHYDDGLEDSSS